MTGVQTCALPIYTGSAGLDSHQMALLGDLHNGVEITFHSGFTGAYKAVQTGGLDVSDYFIHNTAYFLIALYLGEDLDCETCVHC